VRTDAGIEDLARAFEGCTLPKAEWTHPEHLTVALWYLRNHPGEEATGRMREGIRRFNLTWVAVISRFLAEHNHGRPLSTLVGEVLERCGDKGYLLRFYSEEVLMSDEARRGWVPHDLRPIEV
jgi:hypothetical protein